MDVLSTVGEVRSWRRAAAGRGRRVGLVPTMGALHAGHRALLSTLRPQVDLLVASVFVNPTQFGPGEDLERYPRDLEGDLRACAAEGCDAVFAPPVAELYPLHPRPAGVFVTVPELEDDLEGAVRPGHFRGVATVVTKLLVLFAPEAAAFGQKDGQQCIVVRRVVSDLLLPTEVVVVPTVREPDGLALSSRNVYLSPAERRAAPALFGALRDGLGAARAGERDAERLERDVRAHLAAAAPAAAIDYVAVRRAADLAPLPQGRLAGRCLLLVAARLGSTRLLDNICLRVAGDRVEEDVL